MMRQKNPDLAILKKVSRLGAEGDFQSWDQPPDMADLDFGAIDRAIARSERLGAVLVLRHYVFFSPANHHF